METFLYSILIQELIFCAQPEIILKKLKLVALWIIRCWNKGYYLVIRHKLRQFFSSDPCGESVMSAPITLNK